MGVPIPRGWDALWRLVRVQKCALKWSILAVYYNRNDVSCSTVIKHRQK